MRIGGGSKLYVFDKEHAGMYGINKRIKAKIAPQVQGVSIIQTGVRMDKLRIRVVRFGGKDDVYMYTDGKMYIKDIINQLCKGIRK